MTVCKYVFVNGGRVSGVFSEWENTVSSDEVMKGRDIKVRDIQKHVILCALSRNPFYYFDHLSQYFPNIHSLSEFADNQEYLGGLEITFIGSHNRLQEISHVDYLLALTGLLQKIETEIRNNSTEFEGSAFYPQPIRQVFRDKEIRIAKGNERADGQEDLVSAESWYAYNANYGTSEEKNFVKLFSRRFEGFSRKFENVHVIRNEREIKIFDKLGRAFEPDFLLFCNEKNNQNLTFQVFIEPKGTHLRGFDKWKEDFLKEMGDDKKVITVHTDRYKITAVPFYHYDNENEFKRVLENTFEI